MIDHRKSEKVDRWTRKRYPERFPIVKHHEDLQGENHGTEEADKEIRTT